MRWSSPWSRNRFTQSGSSSFSSFLVVEREQRFRFLIVSSPFSLFSHSLFHSLFLSLSLFSYVDERKKKKGKRGGTERKAYCLAYAMANENSFGQGLPEIRFGVAILPFSSLINLSIKIFFIYFSFTLILLAGLKFQKRWVEILSFLALTRHSLEITNHRGAFKSFLLFTFHIFSFHSSPSSK